MGWTEYFSILLIYWNFPTRPSLGFTKNGQKKIKYPVSSRYLGENALLRSKDKVKTL